MKLAWNLDHQASGYRQRFPASEPGAESVLGIPPLMILGKLLPS